MSLNYLASRFTCSWPWSTAILLCDGRVVVRLRRSVRQARARRHARRQPGRGVARADRHASCARTSTPAARGFCGDCPLKLPLADDEPAPVRDLNVGPLPSRLYVECTAACNISCFQACCAPETGITRTRQAGMLDFDLFTRVIDEAGPTLGRVDFFNYGEAFLHKRAVEMCEYIKTKFPHIYLYTSTNGLALNEEKARRLVHSGIDEVTFSIDGASQDTYVRYRQRGKFDLATANLRAMADEKAKAGRDVPQLNWRYILFNWNDSDEEMEKARAAGHRVRRRPPHLGDHRPPRGLVLAPLRPGHARLRSDQVRGLGSLRPRQRDSGGDAAGRDRRAGRAARAALAGRAGESITIQTRVRNLSTRPFRKHASYGRRLVRLGAQLVGADGALLNRDHARAWLPGDIPAGGAADVAIDVPLPSTPGRYALKFDLVSEGIDWFEKCGSPTTTRSIQVG